MYRPKSYDTDTFFKLFERIELTLTTIYNGGVIEVLGYEPITCNWDVSLSGGDVIKRNYNTQCSPVTTDSERALGCAPPPTPHHVNSLISILSLLIIPVIPSGRLNVYWLLILTESLISFIWLLTAPVSCIC